MWVYSNSKHCYFIAEEEIDIPTTVSYLFPPYQEGQCGDYAMVMM